MKASDLPEDEWLAHRRQLAETFDRVAALNADLEQRTDTDIDPYYAERQRPATPAPVPQPPSRRPAAAPAVKFITTRRDADGNLSALVYEQSAAEAAAAWKRSAQGAAGDSAFAQELGSICGALDRRIQKLEDRVERDGQAVVQMIAELEARVLRLEQRPSRSAPVRAS